MKQRGGFLLLVFLFIINLVFISCFASAGTLKVTEEHPFLVDGKWIQANELKLGDKIQTLNGKNVTITSLENIETQEDFQVYNIEVENYSNFIIGNEELIVHNSDGNFLGPESPFAYKQNQLLQAMQGASIKLVIIFGSLMGLYDRIDYKVSDRSNSKKVFKEEVISKTQNFLTSILDAVDSGKIILKSDEFIGFDRTKEGKIIYAVGNEKDFIKSMKGYKAFNPALDSLSKSVQLGTQAELENFSEIIVAAPQKAKNTYYDLVNYAESLGKDSTLNEDEKIRLIYKKIQTTLLSVWPSNSPSQNIGALTTKSGVCRHKSFFLVLMLRHAKINAKLEYSIVHMWVSVYPENRPSFSLDPMNIFSYYELSNPPYGEPVSTIPANKQKFFTYQNIKSICRSLTQSSKMDQNKCFIDFKESIQP